MAWSLNVFAEDEVLDDHERQVLQHLAAKQDMRRPMLEGLMECALKGELEAPNPTDSGTLKLWMERMVDAALEDGNVEPDERALLVQLGKRAGLKDFNLELMIDKRRAEWVCRALREPEPKEIPDLAPIYRTLLDGLCCVMASDGKASKSEKEAIVDLAHKTGASLTTEEIEEKIADFVSRVTTNGLSSLLDRCIEDIGRHCTKPANQRVFRRALKLVAKADGEVHRIEKQVLGKLLAACEVETPAT
jgi:tellurite resistance protein